MVRILIADDHQLVRKGLKQILEEEFETTNISEACDGNEAIEKTTNNDYDLVISDLSMPGKSGLDVISHLKKTIPQLPVLILSIHPEEQYALRLLKAGAAGYLTKEAIPEELVYAVKKVLNGKKYVSAFIAEILSDDLNKGKSKVGHELLSERENEIFKLLAEGKMVSQIATFLSLSVASVNTYRNRILNKLNLATNACITLYALENKLI